MSEHDQEIYDEAVCIAADIDEFVFRMTRRYLSALDVAKVESRLRDLLHDCLHGDDER